MRAFTFIFALIALPMAIMAQAKPKAGPNPTKNIPVTGVATFDHKKNKTINKKIKTDFSFENLRLNSANQLVADVTLGATKAKGQVLPISEDPPTSGGGRNLRALATQSVCNILFLNLDKLFLDLLGLTVKLNPVILDINAVPGAGNLLGNLLCAVVNLLNGGLLGGLLSVLGAAFLGSIINQLLSVFNAINA